VYDFLKEIFMPYSQELDNRVTGAITKIGVNVIQKKMFGGTCNLLNGNMMCGVYKDFVILRLGEEQGELALSQPHTQPFDMTGRPMKGWVMVEQEGLTDSELERWLREAEAFAEALPPK
jgi:TfoX/Sxy family transcriptional regulator of competence genes